MNILQIYSKYQIPTNLQAHMLRVAAVGKLITDNFDLPIDKDLIVNTLLLHDMGNIIKFDFSRHDLLDKTDAEKLEEIKAVQQSFITKYGDDCDQATLLIMKELGVPQSWIDLCARSHGSGTETFLHTDDYPAKIAYYCDMRVGPKGIRDITTRFSDLIDRYPNEKEKFIIFQSRCLEIESQLQKVTHIPLSSISDQTIISAIDSLREKTIV